MMPITKTENGHTDLLIDVNGWPGAAAYWQIVKTDDAPVMKLLFSTDCQIYNGLMNVKLTDPDHKILTAFYSNEVNDASAVDPANYIINDGMKITGITLNENKSSVDITVDTIPEVPIILKVNNIAGADLKETYSGFATVPADPAVAGTSSLMAKALADKEWYEKKFCFKEDKNRQVAVNTSLVTAESFILSKEQTGQLVNSWLNGIYELIKERSEGNPGIMPSVPTYELSFSVDPLTLRKDVLFMLTVSLSVKCGDESQKETETQETHLSETAIMTLSCLPDEDGSYSKFVREFEEAFSADNLKMALNTGRHKSQEPGSGHPEVCILRPDTEGVSAPGIGYQINIQQEPVAFAPKLIFARLISKADVPVYPFHVVKGIDRSKPSLISFSSVDVNVWYRQFFRYFDMLLSPGYAAALKILGNKDAEEASFLTKLNMQKECLAGIFKTLMVPVFEDQMKAEVQAVQEDFRQALSVKLSNAGDLKSALRFHIRVYGNNTQAPAYLYGNIICNTIPDTEPEMSGTEFTAGRLSLKPDETASFNVLISSPDLIKDKQGRVVQVLPLDLSYAASSVAVPGNEDLNGSSRFEFISKDNALLSVRKLHEKAVMLPLPLNEIPAAPFLSGQSGQLIRYETDRFPPDLMDWNYEFTYSRECHYPQDALHFAVDFNRAADKGDLFKGESADAFTNIAQFIAVMPDMAGALEEIPHIDDQSGSEAIAAAKTALTAFTDMAQDIITGFAGREPDACLASGNTLMHTGTDSSHRFTVKESCEMVEGIENVLVITISISEESKKVIGNPQVLIDGCRTEPYSAKEGTNVDFCCYFTKDGQPLPANTGQTIPKRTVVLKALNVLVQQKVSVSVFSERNAELIPGRPVNPALVYTTEEVMFQDYYPGFLNNDAVNIASVNSCKTVKGTLLMHLTHLFALLLHKNAQPVLPCAVEVTYDYPVTPSDIRAKLPVMALPLYTMHLGNNPDTALETMLLNWISGIKDWLNLNTPDTTDALLNFNLTFFSNLTDELKPLIKLENLYLKMEDIKE